MSFVEWINNNLGTDVIETVLCTYPTSSYKQLYHLPEEDVWKDQNLFWKVFLSASSREIAVLYGELTDF